ncbi:hypothetical protein EC971742_4822, partial [Escherichia coli 97.1742]
MVISIRRSRHEEGEELVAIWCRSVDATHDFLSAEYRAELEELVRSFLPEAPLWVAVNERDQPVGFMLLSGQHMDALFRQSCQLFVQYVLHIIDQFFHY